MKSAVAGELLDQLADHGFRISEQNEGPILKARPGDLIFPRTAPSC
jgi:hypothetical protein